MAKSQLSPPLGVDIFSVLQKRIIRWEYPPGHRLTEESLCDEFGVSRSPIREALHTLVENGLVDKEPHRGYRVKQPNMQEINELYDVRLALELFVVEMLAARGMPSADWQRLHNTWQAILDNLSSTAIDFAIKKDEEFHETLAVTIGNQTLVQLLRDIYERLHFIRMTDITTFERLKITSEQHLKILDCIKAGAVDRAQEALRMNIEVGRTNVEQAFKEVLAQAYMGHRSST